MTETLQGQDVPPEPDTRGGRRGQGFGGPMGLGDPEDKTVRKVEIANLINKRIVMVVDELCADTHQAFKDCYSKNQTASFYRCRRELALSRECYKKWMDDPRPTKVCTDDYVKDRTIYRATGEQLFTGKADMEVKLRKRATKLAQMIKDESG